MESSLPVDNKFPESIPAGRMPPWDVGELPPAPVFTWRNWTALVGPGLMMAGANIGGGEWLFGPAVTAQYGGTVMWLASLSIIFQVFYNLEVMRYTLYCGEPIITGFFRKAPGPRFWAACYLILDFGAIWPYLASNAAVPLAAAFLGHLPEPGDQGFVRALGYGIFLSALLPLIFGGKIYNSLEKVMIAKIILVLGYLTFIAIFLSSSSTAGEIFGGFFRFGTIPLRAQTVIVGDRFTVQQVESQTTYLLGGTFEKREPASETREPASDTSLTVNDGRVSKKYFRKDLPAGLEGRFDAMLAQARRVAERSGFEMAFTEDGLTIRVSGVVTKDRRWQAEQVAIKESQGAAEAVYSDLADVPQPYRERVEKFVSNQGVEPVGLIGYVLDKKRVPDLNWSLLAGFAAIAGAGGLWNAQISNYARDKGWGMGPLVGAIPSAVGGKTISLSHVGKAFVPSPESLKQWKGWFRHIVRDQAGVWMIGCFLGMALPSMLSLEYVRNAPVTGDKVAAMTAEGLSARAGSIFWPLTLLCGFLVLAPSQVANTDGVLRRWTDVIWTGSGKLKKLEGHKVKYVYYSLMVAYVLWGLVSLYVFPDPFVIVQASTVFMNLALGFSAFHTLWVNCTLLPPVLRPNWLMRLGLICCGLFFLGVFAVALNQQVPRVLEWMGFYS